MSRRFLFLFFPSHFLCLIFSFIRTDIIMCNFVMSADTIQTFSIWLRSLDQTQTVQDVCIEQLWTYLIQICTNIFVLESTGLRSSWIWMALTDWNYLTYSLRVPLPANLNLRDALDLVDGKSFESSRRDILTLFLNDLNNAQI